MNILEKYQEYAQASTDAASIYHRYIGAAMVGAVMGKRLWYQHGHCVIFPNLWVCLLGPSTWSKKSTSMRAAEEIIYRINKDLILPAKVTVEKLYQIMGEHPTGIMCFGELNTLLSQFDREYNVELKSTLTDFYDAPPRRAYASKGGGVIEVNYPALTIMAGSTMDWLSEAAQTKDIAAGFYPRWLFVNAERSDVQDMPRPVPRNQVKAEIITQELCNLLGTYKEDRNPQGEMRFDRDAGEAYDNIYSRFREEYGRDRFLGPFAGRAMVSILKMSMIHAMASRRSLLIQMNDIEYAYNTVMVSIETIRHILKYEVADSKMDAKINAMRKVLRRYGNKGATLRELRIYGPTRDKAFFNKLMGTLIDCGWAKMAMVERNVQRIYSLEMGHDPTMKNEEKQEDWEEAKKT